ncbi:MAG: GDP-mannose 4,6-dehydratase [Magnetococcus sp. DMHC-8]
MGTTEIQGGGLAAPILVTGATGIVGANLVHRLVADGFRPHLSVRAGSSRTRLQEVADAVIFESCDLADREQVAALVQRVCPATVFHLASTFFNPPTLAAETHFQVNLLGSLYLFEALRELPEVRVVFTGTAMSYDSGAMLREDAPLHPGSMIGCSKAATSLLAQACARLYGLQVVELRLFTPFGPWERPKRLIPHVILSALSGQDVRIGDGRQQRDYTYMDDIVAALLLAVTRPVAAGAVYNICSGTPCRIVDVVEQILSLMGNPVAVQVGTFPPRADEIWEISGDNTLAATELGWRPAVSFQEGLQRTIAWFQHNQALALKLS